MPTRSAHAGIARVLASWLLCRLICAAVATSYISSFSDSGCTQLFAEWDGPNGYPNGSCTSLRSKAQGELASFMFTGLDEGCSVTLYGSDGNDMCAENAPTLLADVQTCYNSSWVYYSIDYCTPGGEASTRASSSSSDNGAMIGAIVGGVIGGVALFALILTVPLYFCLIRPRRSLVREQKAALREYHQQMQHHFNNNTSQEIQGTSVVEMAPGHTKHELPESGKAAPLAELSSPFDRNMSDEEKGLHLR
ncbi:hypothetical protein BKCO1_4600016 [Neofusicoccum parvum]|nr:hypothetical protein BKCO1_4600016 [Neofusicoccum parvum]